MNSGRQVEQSQAGSTIEQLIAKHAGGRTLTPETTLEELGLSSLERVELMIQLGVNEPDFQAARTLGDLTSIGEQPAKAAAAPARELPQWPRSRAASLVRDIGLALVILPLARMFAWLRVEGRENLEHVDAPVIFAANHQSFFDGPVILMALPYRLRRRVLTSIAASQEFFAAHFHPERFSKWRSFTSGLNFRLSSLFFNIFPLPQREAGAMGALRYAGRLISEGWCVLIFPEGERTVAGEIRPFQPGVGMMASRLGAQVVPVRLEGLDRVLHEGWHMAKPGRARIKFGAPLRLEWRQYRGRRLPIAGAAYRSCGSRSLSPACAIPASFSSTIVRSSPNDTTRARWPSASRCNEVPGYCGTGQRPGAGRRPCRSGRRPLLLPVETAQDWRRGGISRSTSRAPGGMHTAQGTAAAGLGAYERQPRRSSRTLLELRLR